MSSLNLYLHDEKDSYPVDPYELKTFAILRDYLEPDSQLRLESTAASILNLLPEKDPNHGSEVYDFSGLCIELAEQIPYHHPSQLKLVELLAHIGMSDRLGKMSRSEIEGTTSRQFYRYQLLGQELRENLNGPTLDDPLSYYVNFHAFAAHLDEYHIFPGAPTWAIWALREAHEEIQKETGSLRDTYVLAAAQWILWYGQSFFKHIIYPGEIDDDCLRMWKPGPLYTGTKSLSLHRWRFWKDCFKNIVSEEQSEEKGGYSMECKSVSAKAANIMDALERNMMF